jgi:glycosyltransferase involved in cell wall biosynthesis
MTSPFQPSRRSALAGRTILQIIPELQTGGAERTTIDIAAALTEAGARALVASQGGRLVSELQAKGGWWIPFPAKTKNPLAMMSNVGLLADLMQKEGVDIIHARSRAPAWVAYGAARRMNRAFVTTYHGAYSGKSSLKIFYNSVMARGDAVIANSSFTGHRIARLHPFAAGKIHVIPRGTDFHIFTPSAVDPKRVQKLRQDWGVAPDERIVLLAARLTEWKGQKILINAAKVLKDKGFDDVRYILAGDAQGRDGYVKELESEIARLNLTGIVKLVGHCSDMPAAFKAATAVTVTSTEPEAFGRSAVEAQAMGTPVIVTDLGAVPETVLAPPDVEESARTGWRVPPADAPALAQALEHVLGMGANARERLSQQAQVHVGRSFSLERMCQDTLDVYANLLGGSD